MEVRMQLGNVSDEAVKSKTGKDWAEWLSVLDAAGGQTMTHKQIVSILVDQHNVPDWWCQMITVGYEQARGLREKYQKTDGYSASASKTFNYSITDVFTAWVDDSMRIRWMPQNIIEIRKSTKDRSLRIKWLENSSPVNVDFYPKGDGKTQISINHDKLDNQEDVTRLKDFWKKALEQLNQILENK
jgi:uncharacterized protein YndB with AHSA1/START domain